MSKEPVEIQSPPFNLLAQKITSEGFTRYESRQNWKLSSPGKRLSRNLANEEWSEDGSERNSVLENGQRGGDQQKIDFILEKSKARLAERDADHMKSQSYLYEKHIKEALIEYFKPLEEEFMKEDGYKNEEDAMDGDLDLTESATEEDKSTHKVSSDDFSKAVKDYILKVSGQQFAESLQESDNLLCKSLKLADQLSVLSMRPSQGRTEKLKAYIPILASQLSVQNQKYRETKRSIITGQKEKEFLLIHDVDSFNIQEKWYQIHKKFTESTVVLQINSVKKIRYKYKKTLPSWYCEVKVDGIPNGKSSVVSKTLSPAWNDSIIIKFSNDMLFENIGIEIYECTTTPILVGECFITLQELLENTLFNKTFRVKLPIVPIDKVNEYRMASMPSLGDTSVKNGSLNIMTEQEFRDYMQMAMLGGNNIGLLRASFEVNLEPTFVDLIKEIRAQRLENLEVWSQENKVQVEEQLELLQSSIAPINTLEIDANMGIKVQDGVKDGGKISRLGCGCGIDTCNIF